jgi:hypothetical protein
LSDPKRPGGSRDISDLKARLGLKKAAPAAAPASGRPNGGVVTPGGVVPPPGLAPQAPPQPVVPNAADDPFGAMNHMAAIGTVQRAPEIVVVNDGKGVENVGHKSTGAMVLRFAAPGLVGLLIGVGIGKVGSTASVHNANLDNAKEILGDKGSPTSVVALKQTLSDIDTLLDGAMKNDFRPDDKFDAEIKKLAGKLDIKNDAMFRARFSPQVSEQVMAFYAGVAEVKSMMDQHVLSSTFAAAVFKRNKERAQASTIGEEENAPLAGEFRYGVVLIAPTESDPNSDFGAKIVEMGPLFCNGKPSSAPRCADGDSVGYAYRSEAGGSWIQGDMAPKDQDSVPSKKLVRLLRRQAAAWPGPRLAGQKCRRRGVGGLLQAAPEGTAAPAARRRQERQGLDQGGQQPGRGPHHRSQQGRAVQLLHVVGL